MIGCVLQAGKDPKADSQARLKHRNKLYKTKLENLMNWTHRDSHNHEGDRNAGQKETKSLDREQQGNRKHMGNSAGDRRRKAKHNTWDEVPSE